MFPEIEVELLRHLHFGSAGFWRREYFQGSNIAIQRGSVEVKRKGHLTSSRVLPTKKHQIAKDKAKLFKKPKQS